MVISLAWRASRFLGFAICGFFDTHVFEFAGFEYFAAFQAFHKLGVFFATHDLHAWMLAGLLSV